MLRWFFGGSLLARYDSRAYSREYFNLRICAKRVVVLRIVVLYVYVLVCASPDRYLLNAQAPALRLRARLRRRLDKPIRCSARNRNVMRLYTKPAKTLWHSGISR